MDRPVVESSRRRRPAAGLRMVEVEMGVAGLVEEVGVVQAEALVAVKRLRPAMPAIL